MNHLPNGTIAVGAPGSIARKIAETEDNRKGAFIKAQKIANETGSSVIVYQSLLRSEEFGVAFTLPTWGVRVSERIEPESVNETCERLNG